MGRRKQFASSAVSNTIEDGLCSANIQHRQDLRSRVQEPHVDSAAQKEVENIFAGVSRVSRVNRLSLRPAMREF